MTDLKCIVFGRPGAQDSASSAAIRSVSKNATIVDASWDAFRAAIENGSPDLAIVFFEHLHNGGPQAAIDAHEYLLEFGVPNVVVLGTENSAYQRRIAEFVAGFEVVLESPLEVAALREAVSFAMAQKEEDAPVDLRASGEYSEMSIASVLDQSLSEAVADAVDQLWATPEPAVDAAGPEPRGPIPIFADTGEVPEDLDEQDGEQRESTDRFSASAFEADVDDAARIGDMLAEELELGDEFEGDGDGDGDDTGAVGIDELEVRTWGQPADDADDSALPELEEAEPVAAVHDEPEATGLGRPLSKDTLKVDLPPPWHGKLSDSSAMRVFFSHHLRGSTGHLRLSMGRIGREVTFQNGEPGVATSGTSDPAARNRILASLAWNTGTYSFSEGAVPAARFQPLGEVLEFVHTAVHEGLSLNQVVAPLTPFLRKYPAVTERAESFLDVIDRLPGVRDFLGLCGGANLETIAGTVSEGMERTLKNALFCYHAALIVFVDSARQELMRVSFVTPERTEERRPSTDFNATSGLNEPKILDELSRRVEDLAGRTPHEVFELTPGCGRRRVKERYYQLVKEHHPDSYALAKSPEIKPLAEMIFRVVREAYGTLMREETRDGPSSDYSVARTTSDEYSAVRAPSSSSGRPTGSKSVSSYAVRGSTRGEPRDKSDVSTAPGARPTQDDPSATTQPDTTTPSPASRRRKRRRTLQGATSGRVTRQNSNLTTTQRRQFGRTPSGRLSARVRSEPGLELDAKQLFKTGTTLMASGNNERALKAFEKALSTDKENTTYLGHYAWALYLVDQENSGKALRLLKDAHKDAQGADKEWPALFLGHLMIAEGKADRGVSYYQSCLQANPNNIEARRRLRLHDMRNKSSGGFLDKLFSKGKKDTKKDKSGRKK